MGGVLTQNVSVILPPPTVINRIQFTSLDSMVSETKPSSLIAPVITNQPDKIILTDQQSDEFNQISSKFLDGSISMDEAILQLRAGGKFKDISFIVFYIWLYKLQINHVEGFQPIRPPHQEWMQKGGHPRPPYAGGYGSSNSGSSLGLTHIREGGTQPNAQFVKALQTRWKSFAEHTNVRDCGVQPVMGQDCHVLKHDRKTFYRN